MRKFVDHRAAILIQRHLKAAVDARDARFDFSDMTIAEFRMWNRIVGRLRRFDDVSLKSRWYGAEREDVYIGVVVVEYALIEVEITQYRIHRKIPER